MPVMSAVRFMRLLWRGRTEPVAVHAGVVVAVGAALDGLPPVLVLAIPGDRRREPVVERPPRRPARPAQLRRVERVAPVVARTVRPVANQVLPTAGRTQDRRAHVAVR